MATSFSTFSQGSESRTFQSSSRPPRQPRVKKKSSIGNLVESISRATSVAYDTFISYNTDDEGDDDIPSGLLRRRSGIYGVTVADLLSPNKDVVELLVRYWWSRAILLVLIPAGLVIGWAAIPLPITIKHANHNEISDTSGIYSLTDAIINFVWPRKQIHGLEDVGSPIDDVPGHGKALVEIHFWFFLTIYYGFYLLMGLFYMTSLFNLYNMNWWPARLGGPFTYLLSWSISVAIGIPIYYFLRPISQLNITWILLTFVTMCLPAVIAFIVLHAEDRHSSLRYHQPSGYLDVGGSSRMGAGDDEALEAEEDPDESTSLLSYGNIFTRARSNSATSEETFPPPNRRSVRSRIARRVRRRTRWIPYSYIRFLWFCAAILLGLIAFVLGELYAEIYLRTLPHTNKETIIYVYSWVGTILALDGITAWILGSQVQSYPLEFVFKLYFSLTYYTYIRTLYARLRSPSEFILLQLISSSIVLIIQPIYISRRFHTVLTSLNFTGMSYSEHIKNTGRSFFLRGLSENVSMLAFLGWIVVLHYGPNRKVYPYLSFRDADVLEDGYSFSLTFYASLITWGLEIVSSWAVRRVFWYGWEFGVTGEGKRDLMDFEGLLVASLAVMVHALMNMLMSIIRLKFG